MQYGFLLEPGNALQRLRYMQIHSITFLLTSVRIRGALFGTWRCKWLSAPETKRTTYLSRRFKMQVSKIIVALTVAAGFASASFAQGVAAPTTPSAPAAKVSAPAPATAEKKVEAPKAAEPAKADVKAEAKTEAAKPAKTTHTHKAKKVEHHAAKAEGSAPAPVIAAAPASK
jgi:hypothetical protein